MTKKVLMLLSNPYHPDPRVEREAKALMEAGFHVKILTWNRGGEKQGYEISNGIEIRRIETGKTEGAIRFIINFFRYFSRSIMIGAREKPDIVHAHDFDTLLQGVIISKLCRKKLVYDAHEHYAMMIKADAGVSVAKLVDWVERRAVDSADLLVAANEHILTYLKAHIEGEAIVVMNCIDIPDVPPTKHTNNGRLNIFYAGSLEPQRYIAELMEAVEKDGRTELVIAGKGRLEMLVKKQVSACPRIKYIGYISQKEVLKRTTEADVVFSMLDPSNENYRIATPIKVLEAMALGTPVLVSKGTWSADIVRDAGCGLVLEWSAQNFREAVDILIDDQKRILMGEMGYKTAKEKYDWRVMKQRLIYSFSKLLSTPDE
jgi:glycosyltransferase involved in cell wall biosynthesis